MSRNDRGLLVEGTSHGAVEAANLLSNDNISFFGGGSHSQSTGADMELEEVSLSLRVVSDSQKLGSSTNDILDVPFLRRVSSSLTENRSPSGLAEFQIEATRNRLAGSALEERFVHPSLLKVTFNLGSSAITEVGTSSAFSTVDTLVRTVSESHS